MTRRSTCILAFKIWKMLFWKFSMPSQILCRSDDGSRCKDLCVVVFVLYLLTVSRNVCPQKVQTIHLGQQKADNSFVDVKLSDHVLTGAHAAVKNAVCMHLEEPNQHLQNYGDLFFNVYIILHCGKCVFYMCSLLLTSRLQLPTMIGW